MSDYEKAKESELTPTNPESEQVGQKRLVWLLLPWIARLHPKNWNRSRWDYPQLWYAMPKPPRPKCTRRIALNGPNDPRSEWQFDGTPEEYLAERKRLENGTLGRFMRRANTILKWSCGHLTAHEISDTEWGYGGGKFVDRHCRWCDKIIKVPKAEEDLPHPALGKAAHRLGFDK